MRITALSFLLLSSSLATTCRRPPRTPRLAPAPRLTAPAPGTVLTGLVVAVLDRSPPAGDCTGIAPSEVTVRLDGFELCHLSIPCSLVMGSPPPYTFCDRDVPAGAHGLMVGNIMSGIAAQRRIELPVPREREDNAWLGRHGRVVTSVLARFSGSRVEIHEPGVEPIFRD